MRNEVESNSTSQLEECDEKGEFFVTKSNIQFLSLAKEDFRDVWEAPLCCLHAFPRTGKFIHDAYKYECSHRCYGQSYST